MPAASMRSAILVLAISSQTLWLQACGNETAWRDTRAEAGGSETVSITNPPACTDCHHLKRIARFDVSSGEGLVDESFYVVASPAGEIIVGASDGLRVYMPGRGFVRKIGRHGQGPLEFQASGPLFFDDHGALHIVDQLAFRETILHGGDLALDTTRSLPLGPIRRVLPLGDTAWIAAADLLDVSAVGAPLHLIRDGSVVRSFGAPDDSVIQIGQLGLNAIPAGITSDGLLIVVHQNEYKIEAWDLEGRIRLRAARRGVWESWDDVVDEAGRVATRPFGTVTDARLLGRILMVASHRPKGDWRSRAVAESRLRVGQAFTYATSPTEIHESLLELIDLETGRVRSQIVSPDVLIAGFIDDERMWGYSYGDDGRPVLEVLRLVAGSTAD